MMDLKIDVIDETKQIKHLTIGDLADELGVSTRTIRYYEERGMISPQRTAGGQRIYTRRERGRLKLILRGKSAGLDLEEIKEIVSLYDVLPGDEVERAQAKKIVEIIGNHLAKIEERMEQLSSMKEMLAEQHSIWSKKSE